MKIPEPSEHQSQVSVFQWAAVAKVRYPELETLYAVPNGVVVGGRNKFAMVNYLKAEGFRPGVADIILPVANSRYISLQIEMKKAKGVQSDDQKEWQRLMTKYGHAYRVARSSHEAIALIELYLRGELK